VKHSTPVRWRSCAALRTIAFLLLAVGGAAGLAAPYVPADDAQVLEHVPARSALERLRPLRQAVTARPQDLEAALALARGFIETGQREGDPRFVAYAESVLQPWLDRPRPPEPALVLEATALQYLHQFDAALALLERALALEPLDGQAWLTRAALLELQGRYADARRACARLVRSVDTLVALTCLASVNGRNGELATSYATLRGVPAGDPRLPPALRSWTLAVLAEMAERLGDCASAAADLSAALENTPDDPYLQATYADLLLSLGRPVQVVTLLRGAEAQDALLLRLAIAGKRTSNPEAARWAAMYAERMRAAERDADITHLRERALFLLEVQDEPRAALEAAARNWRVQREPIDVRLYLKAAQLAGSAADRATIAAWLATSRYEDHALAAPAARVAAR
jgi:tetratricopeptide (TPR) repeat protein